MQRRDARKRALEILYLVEIVDQPYEKSIESLKRVGKEVDDFSRKIIDGVLKNKEDIDQDIDLAAARWTIKRMPILDRNILRMAIYEIKHEKDIPVSVSINEAVELAKMYGTPDSSKFVNGVLGNISKKLVSKKEK